MFSNLLTEQGDLDAEILFIFISHEKYLKVFWEIFISLIILVNSFMLTMLVFLKIICKNPLRW
jgi:hypothetical protein